MVPIEKVKDIITKYDNLEKELSSGNIEAKLFAKKSKEYANLGKIISIARKFVNFENEKKDLYSLFEIIHLNLSQIFVSKHLSNLGI